MIAVRIIKIFVGGPRLFLICNFQTKAGPYQDPDPFLDLNRRRSKIWSDLIRTRKTGRQGADVILVSYFCYTFTYKETVPLVSLCSTCQREKV